MAKHYFVKSYSTNKYLSVYHFSQYCCEHNFIIISQQNVPRTGDFGEIRDLFLQVFSEKVHHYDSTDTCG